MKEKLIGKHRKHFLTLICLLVGMVVLTSAVYANYDSASGYTNYKNAIKYLVFEADNFTAEGSMNLSVDGEELEVFAASVKYAGKNKSIYAQTGEANGGGHSAWQYIDGDKLIQYFPEDNAYYEGDYDGTDTILKMNDATSKKAVRFMELLADTMIGDLKNNVVLVSEEDGVRDYAVEISKSQMPEVINAGLSFMFTAYNNQARYREDYDPSYVTYENYDLAFKSFCKEEYGDTMEDEDWENAYDDFYSKYEKILDEKGGTGILFVKAEGDYEYYPNYEAYTDTKGSAEDMMIMFGTDPYIDDITFRMSIDEDGRLAANYLQASLIGKDSDGVRHTATLTLDAKISDYGTTVAETLDTEGKTKL